MQVGTGTHIMNKQLTVRGIDSPLERQLRSEARRRGLSMNRTVLELLRQALGLDMSRAEPRTAQFADLDHLAGRWTDDEADEFDRALEGTRRIDPELWK